MNSEELTAAVESLQKLEHHYKSQYQDYLSKAMAAKANLDRLEVLLKDLSSQLSLYPQQQESFLEFEPDSDSTNGSREQLELDWMGASLDNNEPNAEPEPNDDKTENQEISHREFVQLSSQVMPILESIFVQDLGKKLHLSFLHKAVNQKTDLGLSQDTVELFLDEAIAPGYCDRDIYDKNCYYSVPDDKALLEQAFSNNPYKSISTKAQETSTKSAPLTKPLHQLPPSQFVKMTVGDTIKEYIIECQPKTFTNQDVLNYLYSDDEQKHWSKAQKTRVNQTIRSGLSNYNNRNWKRIKPGVYKPLLPFKDDSNSVMELENRVSSSEVPEITHEDARTQQEKSVLLTKTDPNHNLPPSPRVKMTIPDTILGYINSYHPKTFKAEDVVNYLYSETEQKHWSKEQKTQVRHSIAAGLTYYNKRNWKRVRAGVYRPINR